MKQKINKKFFIYSAWSPAAKLVHQVRFHVFHLTVREHKSQSFYTDIVDGASSLVATGLSVWCFMSARCSLKRVSSVEGASRFADVEFGTFGSTNNVLDVVRLTVELSGDLHLGPSVLGC